MHGNAWRFVVRLALLSGVLWCGAFLEVAEASEYTLVYGGPTRWADINNNNVAVGSTLYQTYFGTPGVVTATKWSNGASTDFSAPLGLGYYQALATGINDAGVITGWTSGQIPGTPGSLPNGAFRYSGAGPLQNATFIGAVQPGEFAQPAAINKFGQIVGVSGNGPDNVAFATAPNGPITSSSGLGTLGGPRSFAASINNSGVVAGRADTTTLFLGQPVEHAFVYDTTMHDLGTLSPFAVGTSNASAINSSGAAAGFTDVDPGTGVNREAFLHTGTGPLQASDLLGTLGGSQSYGMGVNDHGVVVGTSSFDNSGRLHAFIYRNGAMIDLNTLVDMGPNFAGWELIDALDINNNGWIIGDMQIGQNVEFGFILAPVSGVPELPSWAMMLAGFVVVTFVLRQRKLARGATSSNHPVDEAAVRVDLGECTPCAAGP